MNKAIGEVGNQLVEKQSIKKCFENLIQMKPQLNKNMPELNIKH